MFNQEELRLIKIMAEDCKARAEREQWLNGDNEDSETIKTIETYERIIEHCEEYIKAK